MYAADHNGSDSRYNASSFLVARDGGLAALELIAGAKAG